MKRESASIAPRSISARSTVGWVTSNEDGAVVTFTDKVCNHNLGDSVSALTLEHYPKITGKVAGFNR